MMYLSDPDKQIFYHEINTQHLQPHFSKVFSVILTQKQFSISTENIK